MNRWLIVGVVLLVVVGGTVYLFRDTIFTHDFAWCFAKYGVVANTFPEKCVTPGGREFVNGYVKSPIPGISDETFKPEIAVFNNLKEPAASPYMLSFAVKQSWLGANPVRVALRSGSTELTSAEATPQPGGGEGYQNFIATLTFSGAPSGAAGTLSFIAGTQPAIDMSVTFK